MKISKAQQSVIIDLRNGFVLKESYGFGHHFWVYRKLKGGLINSETVRKATFDKLLSLKLIYFHSTDKFKHKHYRLTKEGKKIPLT